MPTQPLSAQMTGGEASIWLALEDVKDPEIPVLSVVELGIVRQVELEDARVRVTITPTFSGCPALEVMQRGIAERLRQMGFQEVEVATALHPPWTTDWISEAGRAKLLEFGIAPPGIHGGEVNAILEEDVACPYCGSHRTIQKNPFGPTACKSIYVCDACSQPFERFKPI